MLLNPIPEMAILVDCPPGLMITYGNVGDAYPPMAMGDGDT